VALVLLDVWDDTLGAGLRAVAAIVLTTGVALVPYVAWRRRVGASARRREDRLNRVTIDSREMAASASSASMLFTGPIPQRQRGRD
jgi:hypothetical protein